MKFLLLITIIVFLLAILFVAYPIARAIRVSKGIQAQTTAYEQHPESQRIRILIAGDSTGVGTGARVPAESIAGRIGTDYPQADITNISINGLRLEGLVERLQAHGDKQYDMIVLQIGANDVTGFTRKNDIEQRLTTILDYSTNHASSTILMNAGNIGLVPIFHFPMNIIMTSRTLEMRSLYVREAQARPTVSFVDLYNTKETDIFGTDINKYYAGDKFHPSSDGYGDWYKKVGPAVRNALEKDATP